MAIAYLGLNLNAAMTPLKKLSSVYRLMSYYIRYLPVWVSICLLITLSSPKWGHTAELRQIVGVWSIEGLLAALYDRNTRVQANALDILFEIGFLGDIQEEQLISIMNQIRPGVNRSDLIAHIANLLEDPSSYVRWSAVTALGEFGDDAKDYVPKVVALLQDPSRSVRSSAVKVLEKFGGVAKNHLPQLVAFLENPSRSVRLSVLRVIGKFGDSAKGHLPQIVTLLEDPSRSVRSIALRVIGKFGDAAQDHLPQVVALLEDPEPLVRSIALRVIGEFGDVAKDHLPQVVALLEDPERFVRFSALSVLEEFGDSAKGHLPQIVALLENPERSVRSIALRVIGKFGDSAEDHLPQIVALLENPEPLVRSIALSVIGEFGDAAQDHLPQVIALLEDPDRSVRDRAVTALGKFGDAAKGHLPQVVALLEDPDPFVRSIALRVFGEFGDVAKDHLPQVVALLEDPEPFVRSIALSVIGEFGDAAQDHLPQVVALLEDPEPSVRSIALSVLEEFGDAAQDYFPQVVALLEDPEPSVRDRALTALGEFGDVAKDYIPQVVALLENPEPSVRSIALSILGKFGDAAQDHLPQVVVLLQDPSRSVRSIALSVLEEFGDAAQDHIPQVVALLQDSNRDVQWKTWQILRGMGKLGIKEILQLLNPIYNNASWTNQFLFFAYGVTGGDKSLITLIRWLGRPGESLIHDRLQREEGIHTLETFAKAWSVTDVSHRLRTDLALRISQVVQSVQWKSDDLHLLKRHKQNLKKMKSPHQATLNQAIATIQTKQRINFAAYIGVGHVGFWLLLIFLYPVSRQVQAIFFWTPWVRRIAGLGYVSFILTWIPYFRSKLLAPFRDSLLADARLDSREIQTYFHQSEVTEPRSNHRVPITEAIPEIKGQIVLEGDSGLGKTMFVRHLAYHSVRTVVYLRADRCTEGVMEAIQLKLQGQARDARFLRSLIYSGAVDICIDGLNEVTADTRARIVEFAEQYFKGNMILTTQPLDWKEPATSGKLVLQPLTTESILTFLSSRYATLEIDPAPSEERYLAACKQYLADAFDENQPNETRQAAQKILSTPMDLTIMAQMLATGQSPDLFHLQAQQYHTMAADYERINGRPFPLSTFSEHTYQLRLNGKTTQAPSEIDFRDELLCMERPEHKMVRRRESIDHQNQPIREWQFRHDKIAEFFIVQTFLGKDNERPTQHMADPRFRGVYYLLANVLPLQEADALREILINYAADTKDHSVSDTFVQLLRSRKAL